MVDSQELESLKKDSSIVAKWHQLYKSCVLSGKIKPSQRAIELELELASIFQPLVNVLGRHGENKACALFDYGILDGMFDAKFHPNIISSKKEFQLPCGRVDRLLEHADGSFTVVEIKPSGSMRNQAHGLGQSIMYASSMRAELQDSRDVRAALFVAADYEPEIAAACKSVYVEYVCFPRSAQKLVEELAEIHRFKVGG